jgi:hypothetical protein
MYRGRDEAPVQGIDEAPVFIVLEEQGAKEDANNDCKDRQGNFSSMGGLKNVLEVWC